jgi:serine/threonine protein kinase
MSVVLRVGRYEALRPIASGGMATVYLGRAEGARGFERQVAIKAMHPHLAQDPEFVTMFLDEARMAANIRHPNVVPTLDVAEEHGQLFLIMEYVEGLSLHALQREHRKQGRILPLPIALRIALDMLAGLHAAHELTAEGGMPMKLIHRDVSPHNVLVGTDGVSRIMDFGIARAEIRITATQGAQVKGKTAYMAPEQIRAQPLDRRCDVYAAGIVTWELLAGVPLFRADNEGSLVHMVLTGASKAPSEINSAVPKEIDAVCMSALALSPDERCATAADFADALESAAEASGIAIATSRAVGVFIKALPAGAVRTAEGMRTPSVSNPRVAGTSATPATISQRHLELVTGTGARSSLASEATCVPANPAPARTGGGQRAIVAAVAASLVTGAAVWALTRSAPLPEDARGAAPSPTAAEPAPGTSVAAGTPPLPTAAPSAVAPTPSIAASAPSSQPEPRATTPAPPTTRAGKPSGRPAPAVFRPEEP